VISILIALGAATLMAALLTPMIRSAAMRFELLDHAVSARKIHGHPVPRLGGVAILVSFYASLGLVWAFAAPDPRPDRTRALAFVVSTLLIGALGVIDDLRGANAWQKFALQLTAAGLLYFFGFRIEVLANPFGEAVSLGPLGLPFTVLWLVGITNAFNLIDGLDGLAGGVALIALAVNFLIAYGRGETITMVLVAALAGSVMGFLRHNFHPASIFMGDTGSMFLGFVLAALAVGSHQKATTAVAIMVPITALGLPILDTLLALARRAAGGRHLFQADREHIHHRLLALGLTHRRAVLALYAVSGLFGAMAIALVRANETATVLITACLAATVVLLLSRLGYIGGRVDLDARVAERAASVRRIMETMPGYDSHSVWQALQSVCRAIDADCVRLTLVETGADDETVTRLYTAGPWHEADEMFLARFKIPAEGRDGSWVEFGWEQGAPGMDPFTDEAVRLLCQEIGAAELSRHAPPTTAAPQVLRLRR
jgi:UDP-GlcNAc:undecaprenyl-phosphate GlcNAc-1-phosphate transferase